MAAAVFDEGDPEAVLALTGLIDEGSVGAVFAAKLKGELVAVKVVPLEDHTIRKEVENEIGLLKMCAGSAYIVSFKGAWCKEDHAWVALELCEAGSVIDLIQITAHTLTKDEARSVCASTLLALSFIHGLGIVHRDVKGKNVLLSKTGHVKLADFGVAFDTNSQTEPDAAGSPHWMAPEAARGEKPAPSNDVWALGIMLIELIEGAPPHHSIEPLRVLEVIRSAPSPLLRKVPAWGPELSNLVNECLIKDASHRPSSKELLSHPFLDTEIMKTLISGSPPQVIVSLVQQSLPKINAFRQFQAAAAAASEEQGDSEAATASDSAIDYNARDSIVRVDLSLEDRLRQQQMELIFNLAQRYSLKGGEAAALLSPSSKEALGGDSNKARYKKAKSIKISKLQAQFPLLVDIDKQVHSVSDRLKRVMQRMTSA